MPSLFIVNQRLAW